MAEATKFAGAVLGEVYDELKLQFQNRLDVLTRSDVTEQGYYPPPALEVDNVGDIIKVTNDGMANAARNNQPQEVRGVSRQCNVLMSLARDNYSATADRLEQCRNYALYLKRALNEADDPEDPEQSDGMLSTGIRKVEQ